MNKKKVDVRTQSLFGSVMVKLEPPWLKQNFLLVHDFVEQGVEGAVESL